MRRRRYNRVGGVWWRLLLVCGEQNNLAGSGGELRGTRRRQRGFASSGEHTGRAGELFCKRLDQLAPDECVCVCVFVCFNHDISLIFTDLLRN